MGLTSGDRTWIVYQAPPVWDGSKWVDGERFFLSGHGSYSRDKGVDLARSITGLEREQTTYRYNQSADQNGASYQGSVADKRELECSVNIVADSPSEARFNKRRWMDAHPDDNPGKLWVITSDGPPRYLTVYKSQVAGQSSIDIDPSEFPYGYRDFEWGWVSTDAYFRGYRQTHRLKHRGGNVFSATFYNDSTVPNVYPMIYFPGEGSWTVSLGYQRPTFTTPIIPEGYEARLSFHPLDTSFIIRNKRTGVTSNLWPSMEGERPRFSLEANTRNTMSVLLSDGNASDFSSELGDYPRVVFTPLYHSWM